MQTFTPTGPERVAASRQLFSETFRKHLARLETDQQSLHIPNARELYMTHPGMAYHFKPELFIQCGGQTEFCCPEEEFVLREGEICIMPRGVPHAEVAEHAERSFENVVVCYYNETVAIHVAHRSMEGRPEVADIHFFTTEYYHDLVEYLNRASHLHNRNRKVTRTAIKGLMLAEISILLTLVEEETPQRFTESERIFRCQWLIRNNLADPSLSVGGLAKELRCSNGHLSAQFHATVGERIVEYINRLRLRNAIEALRTTNLSVKEIAAASGYRDPNYFARVFRQATQRSPIQYRDDLKRVACAIDGQPKVVYAEGAEYHFGLQPEVQARAHVHG